MGVNWSGLEPHPGQYDTTYLKDLDTRLEYARQHGIYVILDMHQDLYSIKFGNGAPLWATLDNDLPNYTGGVWSDAYYISPAVQTSFDNFWKNTPAADEIGVQDHYIKTWAMLAERYKEDKNIIGFDVMNEPFIGTSVEQVLGVMLMEMTDALNKINPEKQYSVEEVGGMWIDEQGKNFILQNLTHKDVFVKVLEKMEPIYSHFEKSALMPFYTNFAKAVRKVNTEHILI
ncbi:MAG: cellulase family glycosylhydrolase [Chitinophagales bacterium]|nr:cellulase family glycosylhydrolase [Chitinophagales bacterium]